ncbi:2'-5' RNA ligase [Dehalogenimonas formicexedens]|uniref:RNA 2',3'-cyclic phosphodiesterase n=1 Tax=Dehalogenimonas formicexedens TaxID=1839801 RepID=A0A1P8FAI4_9CHLR|nr:RNA 2',3'-cyclic phosphodiesterase [Dehalogenimonas formicexedens]APV45462.1 2'-5' RNA ligase [Dehalogenimonas formicexedens]
MTEQVRLIRSFIAIELPQEAKDALAELQRKLNVQPSDGIKWVAPESIHLTLKFLGWVPADRIEQIKRALSESVTGFKTFELRLSGLGAFPNLRRLNVVWCGLAGDLSHLNALQQSVERRVSPLGYPTENRLFSPHLTLARLRDEVALESKQKLAAKLVGTKFEPDIPIPVDSVNLMQSTLLPTGAIYNSLGSFVLNNNCDQL